MFKYIVETYENNAWSVLNDVALPITDGDVLDETLAEGKIDVKNTTRSVSLKPMTRLRIKLYENGVYKGKIQRVVGTTKKTRKRMFGTPLFDYEIQTLELTKLLERTLIGSMTSTKYINRTYSTEDAATPTASATGSVSLTSSFVNIGTPPTYKIAYQKGTSISIPNSRTWLSYTSASGVQMQTVTVLQKIELNGQVVASATSTQYDNGAVIQNDNIDYTLSAVGNYTITSAITYNYTAGGNAYTGTITYSWVVNAFYAKQKNADYTITSIVQRLLKAGKTRRKGIEAQQIDFNSVQATKYGTTPYDNPPEFAFTNSTLLDALMQIGGAIHAIPRLQCVNESENSSDLTYEVVYDELGGNEDITAKMPDFVYEDKNYDVNDFCGELDSPAQNLVNSQNIAKGCVSEFGGQDITIRTENSQVEISAETMAIHVSLPIKQMVKLYCLYGNTEYDITPYVYEMAEYKTLSTLDSIPYPYSVGYALCYTIGNNTITGLNGKVTTPTVLTRSTINYAILNILRAVTGNNNLTITRYIDLAFRVVYVPIVETRITQRKPNIDEAFGNVLVYNQGANLVETSAYGQKMRGVIARLGEEITRRTYDFFSFDNLPKVGQIIEGAYIAQANYAFYQNKVRVTVMLTPNFNLLSQYVGLNTNYRLYDISESQTVDRFITYGEQIVLGDSETASSNTIIPQSLTESVFAKMLKDSGSAINRIETAMTTSIDENGDDIENTEVLLPVVSFPFGTSWAFVCAFLDNYGAGYQATDEFNEGSYKRVQRLVPYTDAVGEIEELSVWWLNQNVWTNGTSAVADGGQANIYPQANASTISAYKTNAPMKTGSNPFVLEKDSKERIGVVYQMHLQSNRDSVVIGSALADNCPLCTNYTANAGTAYVLPHTINTFGSVDLTGATQTTFTVSNGQIKVANPNVDGTKAWVIVDANNNIYIGENTAENMNGYFPTIYISTK